MSYEASIKAIDTILELAHRVAVSKALDPLDPADYAVIETRFAASIQRAAAGHEAAAMRKALKELDVDWRALSAAQRNAAYGAAEAALAELPSKVTPPVVKIATKEAKRIAKATKKATGKTFSLEVTTTLTDVDNRILTHAATSQAGFITDEYGRRRAAMSRDVRGVVSKGLAEGKASKEISQDIAKSMVGRGIKRSAWYWETVASNIANRSRTYASLVSYQEVNIQNYIFDAVLDEVTTPTCRFFHGRSFSVEVAVERFKEVEQSADPRAVVTLQPWVRVGKDEAGTEQLYIPEPNGGRTVIADVTRNAVGTADDQGEYKQRMSNMELAARGVVVPPLHGGCRSRIIPDFA
jgi:hypothetical protein